MAKGERANRDFPDEAPIGDARVWLRTVFENGATCPCCRQFVKLYKRPLGAGMASSLIAIYRWFLRNSGQEWMSITEELKKMKINAGSSNTAILRHWGLLEKFEGERDDGSKRVGLYRMTDLGRDFVLGRVSVTKHIYQYNDEIVKVADPDLSQISVHEALGNKFDYNVLMGGTPDGGTPTLSF